MNSNKLCIMVAEWCPYCREAKDTIFKLTENYFDKGNISILEESTEEYKKTAVETQEFGLPTFLIIDENGKKIRTWGGSRDYSSLLKFYVEFTETEPIEEDAGFFVEPLKGVE